MAEARRRFDEDFKIGAVRIVRESGKPIAQVARELGINEGTLGNWCAKDRRARGEGGGALSEDERVELSSNSPIVVLARAVRALGVRFGSAHSRCGDCRGRRCTGSGRRSRMA